MEILTKIHFTWIIDTIDGTKAFISGIPVFTFLLSLKYRNDYLLGLVDQPILNERFWNFNNKAYLNSKAIKVRKFVNISSSLVAITDPIMFKNYSSLNKKLLSLLTQKHYHILRRKICI